MVKQDRNNGSELEDSTTAAKPSALNLVSIGGDGMPVIKTQKSAESAVEVQIAQEKVPALPVVIFAIGYITFGAVLFSAWEKWSFLEGFYFSFITLTTIGIDLFHWANTLQICIVKLLREG